MFTGIVEATGRVVSFKEEKEAWRLRVDAPDFIADTLALGDSLANNGCCLTVVGIEASTLSGFKTVDFDLLEETVRLTGFAQVKAGSLINLERSLASGARLGGHFVTGHIDARGTVAEFAQKGKNYYLKVSLPKEFGKYAVYKGSVALDGISLTIAQAYEDALAVWLIPHTLEVTNLSKCKVGELLNLEFDILAKYVEKFSCGNREKSIYQPQE